MNQKVTRCFAVVKQGFMSLTHLMTFIVGVLMLGVIFFLFIAHKHDEQKMVIVQTELKQLSNIEANLNALIEHIQETPPASSHDVEVLSTQVTKIGTELSTLQDQPNTPEIKAAIAASTEALSGQLNSLKQLTIAIKTAVTPKRYLPESTLPFEVVGIDVWNGESKATIKTVDALAPPMGVNETQDGWTLVQLNTVSGEAIFQNEKNQQVLVRFAS